MLLLSSDSVLYLDSMLLYTNSVLYLHRDRENDRDDNEEEEEEEERTEQTQTDGLKMNDQETNILRERPAGADRLKDRHSMGTQTNKLTDRIDTNQQASRQRL